MIRSPWRLALVSTLAVTCACNEVEEAPPTEELVVARVDGVEVKRGYYESYLRFGILLPGTARDAEREEEPGSNDLTDEVQSRLFDRILLETAVATAARAAGESVSEAELDAFAVSTGIGALETLADAMPLTQRQFLIAYMTDSLLAKRYLEKRLLDDIPTDEASLRSFYEENIAIYTLPPRVRLRLIHVATLRESQQLGRNVGRSSERFLTYAEELSQTSEEEQGKDLGLWPVPRLPESFATAVEGLDTGGVSRTFQDADGSYNMLLVEQRFEGYIQPFEEVSDDVRTRLQHELRSLRTRAYLDRLKQATKVDIITENLGFSYRPPADPVAVQKTEDEAPSESGGAS